MKIATTLTLIVEEPRGVFEDPGEKTRTVFAEVVDVGMNEYYQARSAGIAPEIAFDIPYFDDYKGEKLATWNGKTYRIVRTVRRGMKERLVCERWDINDAE